MDEVTTGPCSFSFSVTLHKGMLSVSIKNLKSTPARSSNSASHQDKKEKESSLFFPPQSSLSLPLILSHFPIQISLKTTVYQIIIYLSLSVHFSPFQKLLIHSISNLYRYHQAIQRPMNQNGNSLLNSTFFQLPCKEPKFKILELFQLPIT